TMNDIIVPKIKRKGFKVGEDLFVAHCPERVLPGNILYEMIHNDRIVGGITLACSEKVAQLYQTIIKGNVIQTNATTAETVKLIENTFRDVNIGLVNEIVRICHDLEIDGLDVIKLANMHPRVNLLQPGPGVGGHCLATDPYFLISTSPEQSQLIHIARMVNEQMPQFVVDVVEQLSLRHRIEKLTLLGLTYKGNCSDMRNSPGVTVYNELCRKGLYDVVAYDPYIDAPYVEKDIDKAVNGSSLLLILTDHDEFKDLSFIDFSLMDHPQVFDTKRVVERYEQPIVYMHLGNVHQYTRKKLASL
ncbi:MAG TPA: nucleotide sugar dehydrogenase, partial [Pseudogracilibacillus sp.]|nr:nucleotide sugar dehydrogenase [Pseudogracilibacillus sp.]